MIPVFKSPITSPTSTPVIMGRDPRLVPSIHSNVTNIAMNPIKTACTNIIVLLNDFLYFNLCITWNLPYLNPGSRLY